MIYKTQKDVEENVKIGKIYKWNNNLEGYFIVKITRKNKVGNSYRIRGYILESVLRNDSFTFSIDTMDVEDYENVFEEITEKTHPWYFL